jgi:pimeloyl-ACP methyl ester carboxylesterase
MLTSVGDGLFGESYGSEPFEVLALPGWMRKRSDFRVVLASMNALALDLPGFGGSSPEPDLAGGARHYADLVAPALGACADRVVIVGHSFGGRVAVHLAEMYPERVAGLVLTGVPLLRRNDRPPPRVSIGHRVARWAHRRGLVSDERMESRRRKSGSADYQNSSGIMRQVLVAVVQEAYEPQLQSIASAGIRTALVWGASDDDVPISTAERAAELLGPEAYVEVIAGAGHLLPLEQPDSLIAAIAGIAR